jgi:hypothetical protein
MLIDRIQGNITFGYSNILKTEFKKGHLPSVKKGFYGDDINVDNVSLEHCKAKSKGGASVLSNYVLTSKRMNNLRGNDDIRNYFNPKTAQEYLEQFLNVKIGNIRGKDYIKMILNTLKELGIDFQFKLK